MRPAHQVMTKFMGDENRKQPSRKRPALPEILQEANRRQTEGVNHTGISKLRTGEHHTQQGQRE